MYVCILPYHVVTPIPASSSGPSIFSRIERHKSAIVEPRSTSELSIAMSTFYSKLADSTLTGAVFFAVCRGKVSEGLDFADRNGRAVIVTGNRRRGGRGGEEHSASMSGHDEMP